MKITTNQHAQKAAEKLDVACYVTNLSTDDIAHIIQNTAIEPSIKERDEMIKNLIDQLTLHACCLDESCESGKLCKEAILAAEKLLKGGE